MKNTYDMLKNDIIKTPDDMRNFLNELEELYKKYNMSISHEDHQGSFIIERYTESNVLWIRGASKNY